MSGSAHNQPGCGTSSCACKSASSSATAANANGNTSTVKLPKRSTHTESKVWGIDNPDAVDATETTSLLNGNGPSNPKVANLRNYLLNNRADSVDLSINALLQKQPKAPLADKCDRPNGVCCKDEVKEGRKLIDPDVVRDIIIGLSDGLTVPFALTAGLSSLGSSKLVYMGGLAEIVGGAFSMGVGGYLAAKSDQDIYRRRYMETAERLTIACSSELEREVHEILGPLGLNENVSRIVARSLNDSSQANEEPSDSDFKSKSLLGKLGLAHRSVPQTGTAAFLLKLGEGMEEVSNVRLFLSALTIGMSYAIGGMLPIIPYFFIPVAFDALKWSIVVTSIILIIFGALKSWFTGAALGPAGVAWGAVSTLAVVAAAAGISYGIVKALEGPGDI